MAEINAHASILIATSFQALGRVKKREQSTLICDSAVVIIFAAFFIESNASYMIDKMGRSAELKKNSGLGYKLGWFYNNFIAKTKIKDKKKLHKALTRRFPGFAKIHRFRNGLAHGTISREYRNARRLRVQAKAIVDDLFKIVEREGFSMERGVTYQIAIRSEELA